MGSPDAKGRMLNKEISDSKKFASLSPEAAVLFCMLVPHFNSHGKMNGNPGVIKGEICPRIPYLTVKNIPKLLEEISESTNVKWFRHDGRYWVHSVNFLSDHQRLRREKLGPDKLPDYSGTSPVLLPDHSGTSPDLVPHEVEVEVEVEGEGTERPDAPPEGVAPGGGEDREDHDPVTDEIYISGVKTHFNTLIESPRFASWEKDYGEAISVYDTLWAASHWLIEHPNRRRKDLGRFYGNWLRKQYADAMQRKHDRAVR